MITTCDHIRDQLSELVDGDPDAVARHAAHLADCDACRDARHDAAHHVALVAQAGADHIAPADLVERILAAVDRDASPATTTELGEPMQDTLAMAPPEPPPPLGPIAASHAATPAATGRDALAAAAATESRATARGSTVAAASERVPTRDLADPVATTTAPLAAPPGEASPAATVSGASGARAVVANCARDSQHAGSSRAPGVAASRQRRTGASHESPAVARSFRRLRSRSWIALGAATALAAAATGLALWRSESPAVLAAKASPVGKLAMIERAAAGNDGVTVRAGASWLALHKDDAIPAGAELRTDERTRAALELADGTRLVLDHLTAVAFDPANPRLLRLAGGRLAADVADVATRPAAITTPAGRIDAGLGGAGAARFSVTATDGVTAVQVTRGAVVLANARGEHDDVRAGEEGVIERGALAVSAAPGLVRDTAWAELAPPRQAGPDEATSGLGALRAYKPGETRDRDWNLALARHDVKIRVVGPIARTEITETFRNDAAATLEGVYQFPLPPDAQIDRLGLDVDGGFVEGAFVDKERGAKIWRGVIDKASPRHVSQPSSEIIWVEGRWRDPALLDWKRGGRFELKVYPIPAHGTRTIKLAYTQVVTPRGSWRQYSYPLPHSRDGSTVADQFTVDVELRGAEPGRVRTAGYELVPDPARQAVNALTLSQAGFVPRGDLVIDYRASDGDAELRAWTFAGGAAAAPDDKLAGKRNVGIDPRVVAAQRAVAADLRPTAVLALHPRLPRWREGTPRDYMIVVDASQSMVGERFARATELAAAIVQQLDRRDRFALSVCDSACRQMGEVGELRTPSAAAAAEATRWLANQQPAGASDVVASLRAASASLGHTADREPWILYIGDGFASTGFRRVGDVERAIASSAGARITAIGIGGDADAAVLEAAARGGGGSYLAWLPGQRAATTAAAALESTVGAALRDAVVELPAGLTDVAPTVLPTVRAGQEVLIAARITGDVAGDVIVRGRVAGQPFEQRYPLKLAVSSATGNAFVPRLWAKLAIDQRERGLASDRASIVALSQGYGVMSRETSLLVLESQAMFDAFGVDRNRPTATWTGEDAIDEVASTGAIAHGRGDGLASRDVPAASKPASIDAQDVFDDRRRAAPVPAATPAAPAASRAADQIKGTKRAESERAWRPGKDWIQLRRVWVRVPSVAPYDAVPASITRAISDAEAALAASPDSREKHRALVQALSYAGELDRARDVAKRWLERDQLDPQALGYLADLLGRDGQRELALRTLAGLVDLDADRVALHERMVRAYEQVGRLAQACAHRIALAAIQPRLPAPAAGAVRCLRALGRDRDAELILAAAPDDAARAAIEKAALIAPVPAAIAGDLVVKAHWTTAADLDLTLVTPDGTRVSWMGGRSDAVAGDATTSDREELAVKALRRGNYLVEITRASGVPGTIRGALDITALGARRSIPFELTGARTVVGRVSVRLEERFEDLDGSPVLLYNGPDRRIIRDR